MFVAVDFPDFNFRLMARLAKLGVPIVYYISPQLWAWRTGRMQTMRRLVSKVLVIFPFEEEIYARAGVPVQFVGHPLVEMSTMAVAGFDRQAFLQDAGPQHHRAHGGAAARQPAERAGAPHPGAGRRHRSSGGARARRAVRGGAGAAPGRRACTCRCGRAALASGRPLVTRA